MDAIALEETERYYECASESGVRCLFYPDRDEVAIILSDEKCQKQETKLGLGALYCDGKLISYGKGLYRQGQGITAVLPYCGTELPNCRVFELNEDYIPTSQGCTYEATDWERKERELRLTGEWPTAGIVGYYPQWGYLELDFNKKLDDSRLKVGTLISESGEEIVLEAQRGVNAHGVYLAMLQEDLELNTKYTLTIPAYSVCAEDGELYPEEISISFTTASNAVQLFYLDASYHIGEKVTLKNQVTGEEYVSTVKKGFPAVMLTDVAEGTYDVLLDETVSLGTIFVKADAVNRFELGDRDALRLLTWWPQNETKGYYPQWGYMTFNFSKNLDSSQLKAGTLVAENGKKIALKAQRGATSYSTYLAVLEEDLKLNTTYTLTIPANSVCSTDQERFQYPIQLSFTTASNVVRLHYREYKDHLGEIITIKNGEVEYSGNIKGGNPTVCLTDVAAGTYDVWLNETTRLGTIKVKENRVHQFAF